MIGFFSIVAQSLGPKRIALKISKTGLQFTMYLAIEDYSLMVRVTTLRRR